MSYFTPELLKTEKMIYRDHQHWIVFLPFVGWLILALFLYWYVPQIPLLAWFIFAFAAISLMYAFISYNTSLFMVTNMRVIMRVGFFQRHTLEIFLDKIEGIQVNQPLLGAALGYGTVTVIGTGGTPDTFFKIANPSQFRRMVQTQIQQNKGRGS